MRILITGASGFLGSRLKLHALAQGHTILTAGRTKDCDLPWRLGETLAPEQLQSLQLDGLIHCAWDLQEVDPAKIEETNIQSSLRLFTSAQAAKIRKILFISTLNADPDAASSYARSKARTEQLAQALDVTSVRAGLVIDSVPGGIAGTLINLMRKSPVLPMIGSGDYQIHVTLLSDLASWIDEWLISPESPKSVITACPQALSFKEILRRLGHNEGLKPIWIPIPWLIPYLVLRAVEALGLRVRLRSDSVTNLVHPKTDLVFDHKVAAGFRQLI